MKKIFMLLILGLFLISFTSALDSLGTFKQNQPVNITQICNDATYITISSLKFPNSTVALSPVNMTLTNSGNFYYEFSNTLEKGRYYVSGVSDGCTKVFATYFDIGEELSTGSAVLNLGFLSLVILLLLVVVFAITNLPSGNDEDGYGQIISVNSLKYFNYGLYIIGYGLLIAVFFLSSNIAITYLAGAMFGQVLFAIYKILMIVAIPFILLVLIIIFVNIFKDKELKSMIEQGIPMGDKF